jgi:hypothetical protein
VLKIIDAVKNKYSLNLDGLMESKKTDQESHNALHNVKHNAKQEIGTGVQYDDASSETDDLT